ncbi:CG12279 [Drosophila busckii]|uniref:CG12279 n=1 Tax=Drosophila busckii TaxID=30019 RepID=A0A0M3QYD7_DROBS|nr:CG12279 [Drosophila busckii]
MCVILTSLRRLVKFLRV